MADDQLVMDLSQQAEYAAPFVRNSEWLWCLDSNPSGNYSSGSSILDTSSLSNSNKWLNWQSAYLAIPQRIRCTAGAFSKAVAEYMAGIKSGFHNTLNSCQVELNGVTVQQSTQLSNLVWSYRLLTNMSYNDLVKQGSTIGFYPDDSNSWLYNASSSKNGPATTCCNNKDGGTIDVSVVTSGCTGVGYNKGFLQRQNWLSYNAASTTVGHYEVATEANLAQIFKSNVTRVEETGAVYGEVMYNMIAVVRLRDICPLFAQLGLCKGLLVRLTMTLNQPTFGVAYTAGHLISLPQAVSFPYGGQTNPVMIAASQDANGGAAVADSTVTVDFRVGTTAFSTASSVTGSTTNPGPFGQQNIRLWIQSCILAPEQEAELIANPIRRYHYHDIYEMDFSVLANDTANQLLFNGVPRCRRLILIPLHANGTVNGQVNPFDGQGAGTTLPMAGITNYQVYLSGMPLFPTPIAYDYRNYVEQFSKSGLNYGLVEGLSSGLIGQDQWENNYRYYVVDLHQGLVSEDDVTKNLQVSFVSQSSLNMRMYAFVEYERQLELNILSSAIVSFK